MAIESDVFINQLKVVIFSLCRALKDGVVYFKKKMNSQCQCIMTTKRTLWV